MDREEALKNLNKYLKEDDADSEFKGLKEKVYKFPYSDIHPALKTLEKLVLTIPQNKRSYIANFLNEYNATVKTVKILPVEKRAYFFRLVQNNYIERFEKVEYTNDIRIAINSYITGRYRNELKELKKKKI